jgi:carnitine O-acetyltransferase
LEETCAKYLRSVRPHLNDAEFSRTESAVKEFIQPNGLGSILQQRLVARAQDPATPNWLSEWWNSLAYMNYRDPIVVNVSYFYTFLDDRRLRNKPTERAANIITAALDVKDEVLSGTMEPEMAKGKPLCMDSYKWMFNACRYPAKPDDYARTFDGVKHVAVVRKNRFWVFDVVDAHGTRLSTADIQHQLDQIVKKAGELSAPAVGSLTTQNRDVWTEVRQQLLDAHPENAASLQRLESSTFLLCLDDTKPSTREQVSWQCWVGDGKNRYFDKSLQFIVFENGKAGFNGEHSCMDGTPTCRLNDVICHRLAHNLVNHGTPTPSTQLPEPRELTFHLTPTLHHAIQQAEQAFQQLTGAHALKVVAYPGYGKRTIKRLKASPDAYAQMVIQLAYYKMHGISRPTYESGQTRKFLLGRTEVCRTVSTDSVAWVKAMENPAVSALEKAKIGRKAIDAHVKYMADAVEGHGCDRHLLGLRLSLREGEARPSIFTDPAYAYTSHWFLSTSQLTSEYFDGYGWGEVVPDGYGIAYMVKEDSLHFNIVARKEMDVEAMGRWIEEACGDMLHVFEQDVAQDKVAARL